MPSGAGHIFNLTSSRCLIGTLPRGRSAPRIAMHLDKKMLTFQKQLKGGTQASWSHRCNTYWQYVLQSECAATAAVNETFIEGHSASQSSLAQWTTCKCKCSMKRQKLIHSQAAPAEMLRVVAWLRETHGTRCLRRARRFRGCRRCWLPYLASGNSAMTLPRGPNNVPVWQHDFLLCMTAGRANFNKKPMQQEASYCNQWGVRHSKRKFDFCTSTCRQIAHSLVQCSKLWTQLGISHTSHRACGSE